MTDSSNRRNAQGGSLLSLAPQPPKAAGSLLTFPADSARSDQTTEPARPKPAPRAPKPRTKAAPRKEAPAPAAPSDDELSLVERLFSRSKPSPKKGDAGPAAAPADKDIAHSMDRVEAILRSQQAEMSRLSSEVATAAHQPSAPVAPVHAARDYQAVDDAWRPLIDPVKVVNGVLDAKGLILALTLLGGLLGGVVAYAIPKEYAATAEVLIDPRDLKIGERPLTEVNGLPSDSTIALVENQVRVMTSGVVLNKVVEKLNLENDPDFNGKGFDLNPINLVRGLLTRSDGADDAARRRAETVTALAESLKVERTGRTFVVLVTAKTPHAETSAKIANTMIKEYIAISGDMQSDSAGRANKEVVAQLDRLRKELEVAEQKVEKYRAENDLVGAQGRLISEDEIFKLNDQLAAARARTIELNARAESARNMSVDAVVGGAIPEVAASSIISELRAQYAAAKQEMDRLAVRIGPRHPAYQSAQAQVSALQNQISAELKRVSASVQTELKRSVQLEQDLAARLAQLKVRQGDVSSEMVTLRDLERDAQAKRSVYEAYLLRANETSEQQQINSANVSIISEATPPIKPAGISRVIIAAAGAFLGLMSGIGFGAMRGAYGSLQDTAGGWRTGSGAPAGEPAPRGPAAARRPEDEFDDIEDDSMNPYYPPHGYAPYPQPHGQAQQPAWPQPQAAYPQQPMPPAYPPQMQYPQQQPVYPPQAPQAAYPSPPPYQPQPYPQQAWPQSWPPAAVPAPQPVYAQPAPQPQAYAPQPQYPAYAAPYAPPAPEPAAGLSAISETVREFRDAVRELTETRLRRRYF